MNNFAKELNWEMLEQGVDFIKDGRGTTYCVRFTVYDYNNNFIIIVGEDIDSGESLENLTRRDINDVKEFIKYFINDGDEEGMEDWYIS